MIKKRKKRCRDCIHYVFGYTSTTQVEATRVCDRREKRIYRSDYNGVYGRIYHYAARPYHTCEYFEQKEIDENKEM